MLNINQLEYLKTLVQFGNFSVAAKKLQITQPALSLQIAKLEKEIGFRLLDRRKRPLELTSEGEVFYQKTVDILLKFQELNKVTTDMGEQISGNLKIGIIPTLAPYLVPMFINDLNKNYSQLQVEISELKTEEIIHELKMGNLDCGILSTPLSAIGIDFKPLFYERFYAYISPNHPLCHTNELKIADLNEEEIWYLEEGNCFQNQVNSICKINYQEQANQNLVYRSNSIESLRRIVENKGGITFIPELATINVSAEQEDLIKAFSEDQPTREISVVTLKNYAGERRIKVLQDSILKNIPQRMKKQPTNWIVDTNIRI